MNDKIEVYGGPGSNENGLKTLAELGAQALALDDGTIDEPTIIHTLDNAPDEGAYQVHIGGRKIGAPGPTTQRPAPSGGYSP